MALSLSQPQRKQYPVSATTGVCRAVSYGYRYRGRPYGWARRACGVRTVRLFDIDPRLKSLFHSDMNEQGKKLMHIIGVAVHGLKNSETLIPAVQDLGRRHVQYGVEAKDDETVGKALMLALEQGLGADFTPQVREAWSATYELLSGVMNQAAYSPPQAA
jgi:hemoglobin-like flavoprotein